MDQLNELLKLLNGIQGLSAAALVALSCIAVGYCLRFIKSFPNDGIPLFVVMWGAVAMLLLADARPTTMPARLWTGRNFFVGLTIGFFSWLLHRLVLSRFETWVGSFFPNKSPDDTQLSKAEPEPTEQTPKP